MTNAYMHGYVAAAGGLWLRFANPFLPCLSGDPRLAWFAGYDDAMADARFKRVNVVPRLQAEFEEQ